MPGSSLEPRPRRITRPRLVGALAAALALGATPTAFAVDDDPAPAPVISAHQIVNTSSRLALTAGASGKLYLTTRSATNEAQQFTRKIVGTGYRYRYQSRKFPGQCIGAGEVNGKTTPRMVACTYAGSAWRFYDFYGPNPSSGIFYFDYPSNNGQTLIPSGTGVALGSEYWSSSGDQAPAPTAFWSDKSVVIG